MSNKLQKTIKKKKNNKKKLKTFTIYVPLLVIHFKLNDMLILLQKLKKSQQIFLLKSKQISWKRDFT